MDILIRMLMAVLKDRKHKKQRRVLSTVMAAVVVFMTTYSLILPAITLEESTAETTDGIFLESADVSEADPADDDVDPSGELLLTDDAWEESAPASDGWEDGLIEDADWEENGELADIPDEPALTDTGDEATPDGILEEATDAAEAEEDTQALSFTDGELTVRETLVSRQGGEDFLRLTYGAEARIPEDTVCSAQAFIPASSGAAMDEGSSLAEKYEQAAREKAARDYPEWDKIEVRMFDLQLAANGQTVQAEDALHSELTLAQPIRSEALLLLHFEDNEAQEELRRIYAGETAGASSVEVHLPEVMHDAEFIRNANGEVYKIRFASQTLNTFAVVIRGESEETENRKEETAHETEPLTEAGTEAATETLTESTAAGDETEEAAETETGNVYAETEEATEAVTETASEATEEATEDTTESEESVGEGETESELEEQYPEVEFSDSTQYTQVQVYAPEGAFPEGTQMLLSDVEDDETIAAICDAALTENSLVQKVHAVDISFRNSRNEEVEPLLPIRVEMTAEKCAEVGSSSVSSSVVHVDDSGNATIVENAQKVEAEAEDEKDADKLEDVETIAFEAKEFSVYALVYTVDFETVDGGKYSIPGEGSYKLNDLLPNILGKEGVVSDATLRLIEGKNNKKALYLTRDEQGDWYINSDVAFKSTYLLTVTINNVKYEVTVTDLQYTTSLNEVLTDLTISGAEWDSSTESYTVKPGKSYTVNMTFQESEAGYQFSNDGWMTLTLPAGVTFEADNTFSIAVNEAGENFTVSGNQIKIDGNSIKIKLNPADPNYQKLKNITTAKFSVSVTGRFNSNQNGYVIDGQTDTKINVDDTPDVNINKSGTLIDWNSNDSTAKVKYRLVVTSNGAASGVVISDVISGTGLTFDGTNTITVKEGNNTINNWQKAQNGNGFTLTTGDLEDGKTYVVEYTATINKSQLVDNRDGTYDLGANNTVEWPGKPSITNHDLDHVVRKPGISKSGSTASQNGGVTTTTWRIEADSDYGTNNQLTTITDRMVSDGMTYGDKLHIVVTDKVTGALVKEDDVNLTSPVLADDGKSWSYDVSTFTNGGNLDKKYHYVITYDTTYDIGDATTGVDIKNDVEDNRGNEQPGQAYVGPNPENHYNLWKEYVSKEKSSDDTIVTWKVHVTVPAAGVPADKAVLTETLPSTASYQDTYAGHDTNWTEGLYSGESVVDHDNGDGTVSFTFMNGSSAGLQRSTDGKARDITLTLKTKCDSAWMADNGEATGTDQTHDNKVNFADLEAHASFTPDRPSIQKNGQADGVADGLPKYTYNVIAGVFSDELFDSIGQDFYPDTQAYDDIDGKGPYIKITDTFDDRLAYVDGSAKVYGGNKDSQGSSNNNASEGVTAEVNGNTITFKLYQNSLPKNNGNLYQYYRINYSLKVKDQTTLEALRDTAISTGRAVDLGNNVVGFGGNEWTVHYEPKILDKSHVNTPDGKLEFTVKVNEDGLTLSDSGVLVLTDEMTNLSVRYQDVSISVAGDKTVETTDADGNPVTAPYFNMKENKITFYIPDGAATTITYRATPRGEVGSDGKIHYSNTVRLKGFEKTDSGEKDYESEASGYGTNYGVYIYKADGNVNSNALGGAVFKLYEADEVDASGNIVSGTPVKGPDGKDYVVTTSDGKDGSQKGVVAVMGNEDLGWNLKPEKRYYLLEVEAPEGYALDPTKYQFIISKDGFVNYTAKPAVAPDGSGKIVQPWTYHNGDVMTVKDWRKDGVLTLQKSFQGISPSEMDDDQKSKIKFEIYTITEETDSGTGTVTTVETLWRTITFDQLTDTDDDGTYSYTIGDLPEGKYRVKEIIEDATCTNTVYAITDTDDGAAANNDSSDKDNRYATIVISSEDVRDHVENGVSVTNTYDVPSEFKIFKHAEGETSYKISGAEFGVFTVDTANGNQLSAEPVATYQTNSRGRFTILQNAQDGQAALATDTVYAVKETDAPEGFLPNDDPVYFCFLSEGKTELDNPPQGIDVVYIPWKHSQEQNIADTPDTTYLEATKVYLNDLLEEDDSITDTVSVRIKQIASYDKAGTVIEEELSGYYKYNAAGPVKPVVAERATTYQIVKDGDPAEWHLSGDGVVDGKLQNLPTMTFDNHIPIYYTYQVEEINSGDYIPMYEYETKADGGTSATVTNKPNTNNPTTRVKAKKKWVDLEGKDVTKKMGVDDGVSVDVYRYVGLLTRGTIYEADGTMRDPSQQFAMTFKDKTGKGTPGASIVAFLPGDRVRVTIKPTAYENGKTFSELNSEPNLRSNWDTFKQGTDYTHIKDLENEQYVFEFTSRSDDNNKDIRIEQFAEVAAFEMTIENLNAEGRSQVLTQADVAGIPDGTGNGQKQPVEILDLNITNNWSAISKEYIKSATIDEQTVTYSYFIVEPDGLNYEAEYSIEGDTITVVNVEKKMEVDKQWFAANGDDITSDKEDGTITYTIKRNKYQNPEPVTASVDYSGLKLTMDNGTVGVSPSNVTIANNILVGSTIKVKFRLPDDHSNAENSSMNGLITAEETLGGTLLSDSGPMTVQNNDHNHAEREYQILVTNQIIKLAGTLQADRNAASGLKIDISILKEPSGTYIPSETDTAVESDVSVGTITVGYDSIVSSNFTDQNVIATAGSTPWSVVINRLQGADTTYTYTYYVEETVAASDDFELVSITPSQGTPVGGKVQVVNRLKPGYLKVKKVVEGVDPGKTYEIAVTDSDGNYYGSDGTNYGSTPHYENFTAGQEKTWNPLTSGTYTVSEKNAAQDGYTWTVTGTGAVSVVQGETAETTVTNSYYKNTDYTPKVTKSLKAGDEEVNSWPAGAEFEFYLSFDSVQSDATLSRSDVVLNNREATATETSKTAEFNLTVTDPETEQVTTLPGIEFKKPGTYVFTIEEVEPAGTQNHKKNGIIYDTEHPVTLTVVVGEKEGTPGELEVKSKTYSPANGQAEEGLITNIMDYPTYAPSVTKSLMDDGQPAASEDWNGKSFTFTLANTTTGANASNVIMPGTTQKSVTSASTNHKETFDAIAFKAAGTYTFTVTEQQGSDPTVQYNTTAKTITVEVEADGDNNLSVTKVTVDGTEVTGDAIIGSGVTIVNELVKNGYLKLTKAVTVNGDPTTTKLADGNYTFTITGPDESTDTVATVVIKVENGVATQYKVDNAEDFSNLPSDKYVVIPDLTKGVYTITETTPTNGTVISKINGTDSTSYSTTVTVVAGDTASVAFTNNINTIDFEFTKEWHDSNDLVVNTWPANKTIKVKVYKYLTSDSNKNQVIKTYDITKNESGFTITPDDGSLALKEGANTFTFQMKGLDPFGTIGSESGDLGYYAVEYERVDGYKEPAYENIAAGGSTYTSGGDKVLNKGKIINRPEESYELPSTGGPGTRLFTILGSILILAAGVLLMRRRRLI